MSHCKSHLLVSLQQMHSISLGIFILVTLSGIGLDYRAQFCRSIEEIVIPDRDIVTHGVLYSPVPDNNSAITCELIIKAVHGSSVIVINFKLKHQAQGQCMGGLSINSETIVGPCKEKKVIISTTEIIITLRLGEEATPAFHINLEGKLIFSYLN